MKKINKHARKALVEKLNEIEANIEADIEAPHFLCQGVNTFPSWEGDSGCLMELIKEWFEPGAPNPNGWGKGRTLWLGDGTEGSREVQNGARLIAIGLLLAMIEGGEV